MVASKKGVRVLVVDDNKDSSIGLAKILTLRGYEVTLTHDGLSAMELAHNAPPDLILLDVGLPGINGYEVAERLRQDERCKAAVLIAISGHGQEEDRRLSRDAGFDHHLVKPVIYSSLSSLLAEHFPELSAST